MLLSLLNNYSSSFTVPSLRQTQYVIIKAALSSKANFPPTKVKCHIQPIVRRSGNYKPSIWNADYLQSLSNPFNADEIYTSRLDKLVGEVRMMLKKVQEPLEQLKLIDVLQRLGISNHFKDEIEAIMQTLLINQNCRMIDGQSLYHTSLEFRLLRQHQLHTPPEVFDNFRDENGDFKEYVCKDTKGLLSFYEAAYLSVENEAILDVARHFTAKHLTENLKLEKDEYVAMLAEHALELPVLWGMERLETRWFIDVYARKENLDQNLLEFATLDFNLVQAKYKEDLKQMSRWWSQTGLEEEISLAAARDRLVENYFWAVGLLFDPQYGSCRRAVTRINSLITTIDDIYDVYGTSDELENFTDAVERWEIDGIDKLPGYMQKCFLVLYNTVNEIADGIFKKHGVDVIWYLKKKWADLCNSYLVEARWFHGGYMPSLEEYLNNAWISVSAPMTLTNTYFLTTSFITEEALQCLKDYPNIFRHAGMIVRLANDLATSSDELKRGDVPKSIQCYMHESGASEQDARKFIVNLIDMTWKKMNEENFTDSTFSKTIKRAAMNIARTAQCIYQYGDGYGIPDRETKERILAVLIEPISTTEELD